MMANGKREGQDHQIRMCAVCRVREPQGELLRIRCFDDGEVIVFRKRAGKNLEVLNEAVERTAGGAKLLRGRSCYVHDNVSCVGKLQDDRKMKGTSLGKMLSEQPEQSRAKARKGIVDFVSEFIVKVSE